MKIAVQAIIKGRVQGVGFRWFARENARALRITGFVRNMLSGDVEVFAEGEEENIEHFISQLKKGPAFSSVTEIVVSREEVTHEHDSFKVLF
jgi:acylphosphatase